MHTDILYVYIQIDRQTDGPMYRQTRLTVSRQLDKQNDRQRNRDPGKGKGTRVRVGDWE